MPRTRIVAASLISASWLVWWLERRLVAAVREQQPGLRGIARPSGRWFVEPALSLPLWSALIDDPQRRQNVGLLRLPVRVRESGEAVDCCHLQSGPARSPDREASGICRTRLHG
jgi:hypothetical protein